MSDAARSRLAVALDLATRDAILGAARALAPETGVLKLGLEAFVSQGPDLVREIAATGARVFLDLKLHDIPTTVERAAHNCARLGATMITVHALGGEGMIAAACRGAALGAEGSGHPVPVVAAVTVLSSLGGESLASPASLAFEAMSAGATAAVVSGEDVSVVREVVGDAFCLVVPGIRPAGSNGHDQVRVLTPDEALARGADYLVVGRPITESPDPAGAARSIMAAIR